MKSVKQLIDLGYSRVIEEGKDNFDEMFDTLDEINSEILKHIYQLDPDLIAIKDNLLIAVRLTECIKIFDWILICFLLGSYRSVYKELRFMVESMCQAFYIDYNHFSTPLETKFEILKALGNYGNFIGSQLIDKTKLNKSLKKEMKEIYGILSNYVHPSSEESKFLFKRIEKAMRSQNDKLSLILDVNKFERSIVEDCLSNCNSVKELILKINTRFEELFKNNEIP